MAAEVYALYSTRDGRVRYVGQSGDRIARFKDHKRCAESRPRRCLLDRWFHQEWRDGYLVRHARLEVCDYNKRDQEETKWIWRFPWADLLNQRKWPPWWEPQVRKPPRVAEIDGYMRRYINVSGFRGVNYDCQTGYYRVLVYNGHWVKWLEGDELPGGSASIWFSDLAQALSARDSEQDSYQALMKDRREADIISAHEREQERVARGEDLWL
jgi:hypothetical protein